MSAGYARVTAAGCYSAVARPVDGPRARALLDCLSAEQTPPWDDERHAPLAGDGLLERTAHRDAVAADGLQRLLPELLPGLSDRERVVLSESRQGLFLDCCGLSRDDAERLAVIGSGLVALLERDPLLGDERLGVDGSAIAIVDPAGHAEVGFWPLHVGRYVFLLGIFGIPRLNTDEFRRLVWVLQQRYGAEAPTVAELQAAPRAS